MARRIQQYENETLNVTFDPNLCVHVARCLQGLPGVFDTRRRKWIDLELGTNEEVIETVERCPSGALRYTRKDGVRGEEPADPAFAIGATNGPVYVRGNITIQDVDGNTVAQGTRFALCRCGDSQNKPFCDNTHRATGFRTPK